MKDGNHYVTGNFQSHAIFLDEETYSKALDSLVIACVDIVLLNDSKIFLAKRKRHPQKDWWIVGGRMSPGESIEQTAQRNSKRELNLELAPNRFKFLTVFSAVWDKRAHKPSENGSHTISIVETIEVTKDETELISINDEYEEFKWLYPKEIIEGDYHPAIKECATRILEKANRGV